MRTQAANPGFPDERLCFNRNITLKLRESMNPGRLAAKLAKMSRREIQFRVRQKVRNTVETTRWKLKQSNADPRLFEPPALRRFPPQSYPFPAAGLNFFGLAQSPQTLRRAFAQHFPQKREAVVGAAEACLRHEFHFLGEDFRLGESIFWNRNPLSGKDYPRVYYGLIDTFNTARFGDVKYVWELNRHQFFIEVAKAYLLSGDEKYAEKIWAWMESWIAENPHKIGINHTSVLEHAMRIFSWTWAYFFTRSSPVWTAGRLAQMAGSLLSQGLFIEENLSYFFSPYNHLIGELAALSWLGTVYSQHPVAGQWRERYWRELETQIGRQFHPDGFTVEQASYYHHYTLGFYLQLAELRRQNDLPVSAAVWNCLEKACQFAMYLTRPDGRIPMIGDIDSARSLYFYRPDDQWDLRAFQAVGAVLFRRPDMKFVAGEPAEEILWLNGPAGLERWAEIPAQEPAQLSCDFPQSGYYLMRDSWKAAGNYCCFDCGEIAAGLFKDDTPSAAHGHADILSFELCLDGKPLIINPGFYTYFGPIEWHRYFRSSRGNNTVEVDGCGQAVHDARIGWSQVSSAQPQCWVSTPELDIVGGAVDRFARHSPAVAQRRYVLFLKGDYFLIFDEIFSADAPSEATIESSLHFAPGTLAVAGNTLLYDDQPVAQLSLPQGAAVEIACGGQEVDQGWCAPGYGQRQAAPVLRMKMHLSLPLRMGMLFPLSATRESVASFHQSAAGEGVTAFTVARREGEDVVLFNPLQRSYCCPGQPPLETDALCTVIRRRNQESEFSFIKLNHLIQGGKRLDLASAGEQVLRFKSVIPNGKSTGEVFLRRVAAQSDKG